MKYPFHRVGSLLTAEEAQCSSIVRDTLASKTEGDGQANRLQLVQAEARLEDIKKITETPKVHCLKEMERKREREREGEKKSGREKRKNKERERLGKFFFWGGGYTKETRQEEISVSMGC